jgi:DNA-directed RNA polymerase beta subunit
MLAPLSSRTTLVSIDNPPGPDGEDDATKTKGQTKAKRGKARAVQRTEVMCRNPACATAARTAQDEVDGAAKSGKKGSGMGRIGTLAVPYVFKYLVHELAAMNIRVTFDTKEH